MVDKEPMEPTPLAVQGNCMIKKGTYANVRYVMTTHCNTHG